MGFLYNHLAAENRDWANCPDLYQYAMVVEYRIRDRYMFPKPDDAIALAIKDKLPDVEEWQQSVIRPNRMVIRFKDEATREIGRNALNGVGIEIYITNVTYRNPPDWVNVGDIDP